MMATYVGAAYGLKHGGHIHVDLVTNFLSPRAREVLFLVTSVLGLIIAGAIAWYSWPMWWEAVEAGYHSESLWGPPLIFPYILLPLGLSFLAIHYLVHIARKIALVRDLFKGSGQGHEPSL
jgi:TRAP-type C4-dicarboxylate transport system permease small subunit